MQHFSVKENYKTSCQWHAKVEKVVYEVIRCVKRNIECCKEIRDGNQTWTFKEEQSLCCKGKSNQSLRENLDSSIVF